MFFRPTGWELVKMLWWGLWNLPPKEPQLPPIKKLEMVPQSHCPTCKRPY